MKLNEMSNIAAILVKLFERDIAADVKFNIIRILRKLKEYEGILFEVREPYLDKYVKKDANGKKETIKILLSNNKFSKNYIFTNKKAYEEEIKKMLELEINLNDLRNLIPINIVLGLSKSEFRTLEKNNLIEEL